MSIFHCFASPYKRLLRALEVVLGVMQKNIEKHLIDRFLHLSLDQGFATFSYDVLPRLKYARSFSILKFK